MPLFFEVTSPTGVKNTYGPFIADEDTTRCRDAFIEDHPDWVVGEPFTEGPNYINDLPRPYATLPMKDGSVQELWTDGTTKTIPAE